MKNSIVFTIVAAIAFAVTASTQAQVIFNRGGVPVQQYPQGYQQRVYQPQPTGSQTRPAPQPTSVDLPPMSEADLMKSDLGATFFDAGNALRVGSVFTNSPAKSAGLRTGDFVTKLNGKAVSSSAAFNLSLIHI